MNKVIAMLLALCFAAICAPLAFGQETVSPQSSARRKTEDKATVYHPVKVDVSEPLREMKPKPEKIRQFIRPLLPVPLRQGTDPTNVQDDPVPLICSDCDPGDGGGGDGGGGGSFVPTTPGLNLLGQGVGFFGPQGGFSVQVAPPDTNGATGSFQYVQLVNISLARPGDYYPGGDVVEDS